MNSWNVALMFALTVGVAEAARAQSCSGAGHRQLDFSIGNWIVNDRAGNTVGTVTITKHYSDCVLLEKWHGPGHTDDGLGVSGYQSASKAWHRDFLDRSGFVIALDGGWNGTSVVLSGKDYHDPDLTLHHRLTWTSREDGTVEQLWQTSKDGGRSWSPHRYALLRRIAE